MIDQNTRFLVYLKKLADKPYGYRVAHLHVSDLPAAKKTRDNISRAIALLAEVKSKYKDGELFLMKNMDILFIAKDISKPFIATLCDTIQQSFLGQMQAPSGDFYSLFDLTIDFFKVLAWAEAAAGVSDVAAPAPSDDAAPSKGLIDLSILTRIKDELQRADITPMLFNQPVYSIQPGGRGMVMWQEMYISVKVLEDKFCPGQSLTARRWLFNDLTEELDAAVLRLLARPEDRGSRKRISININLSTLASSKFIMFDEDLPPENRNGVIFEISKTDVFENMPLYHELVPFLRGKGYRILLDGLSLSHVSAIDFDGIPCDFIKLFWSGQTGEYQEEVGERVAQKIRARQSPLIVLAHCDTADSMRFARDMGIKIVQGRLIDHMIKKNIPF